MVLDIGYIQISFKLPLLFFSRLQSRLSTQTSSLLSLTLITLLQPNTKKLAFIKAVSLLHSTAALKPLSELAYVN